MFTWSHTDVATATKWPAASSYCARTQNMTPRPSRSLLAALAIAAATLAAPASAVPVNTELQLLVDVSGSVDTPEFALQRDGYVTAFQNAAVQAELIANG